MINNISSNYPCLEIIFMVPEVFEPLEFYCILNNLCMDEGKSDHDLFCLSDNYELPEDKMG